ncbi:MAG: oligosaccharide flippase family protein [Firmicutes bacterium]|nr:oligosaccharide flippase family protein [Bacillota bacterium]
MKRETFLGGAMMLAVAGVISRLLGALYRIPLYPLLGDGGMGLFSMAYPIYALVLVLSTTGINVAVSKLVSARAAQGDARGVREVFGTSLWLLGILGAFLSFALFACARYIAENVTRDPRAYLSIAAISPAIFFVSIMSAYRGLFQGLQHMTPTAMSQIIEQVVRVGTMLLLAVVLLPAGVERAAAGASFGAVTGAIAGLAYLLFVFGRVRGDLGLDPSAASGAGGPFRTAGQIVALAIPVSLASGVLGVTQLVDMAVVPGRLQATGMGFEQATSLYGQLAGGALPLMNLPTVFSTALQVSLVPSVSEAAARGNTAVVASRTKTALRLTFILMMPAMVGLYLLAGPITQLLYGSAEIGTSLASLSPGVLFLAVQQVSSGALQGLGMMSVPVKNLLIGSAAKFALTWVLTAMPPLGIRGAAYGTSAGFLLAAALNLACLAGLLGGGLLDIRGMVLKPGAATLVMAAAVVQVHGRILGLTARASVATLGSIGAGVVVYTAVLLAVGGLTPRDIEVVPGLGPRLSRLLSSLGLIRK